MKQTIRTEMVIQMIEWILECDSDFNPDDFTNEQIIRIVARNYFGGIEQFIKDGQL